MKRSINPVAYEQDLPDHLRIRPVFHVSLLEPYAVTTMANRLRQTPPPIMIDDDNQPFYEIERIVDSRIYRRQLQYLIHWKGNDDCERTWNLPKLS